MEEIHHDEALWQNLIALFRVYRFFFLYHDLISSMLKSLREGLHHLNFLLQSTHTNLQYIPTIVMRHKNECERTWHIFFFLQFFLLLFFPYHVNVYGFKEKKKSYKKLSRRIGRKNDFRFLLFKRCCCHCNFNMTIKKTFQYLSLKV